MKRVIFCLLLFLFTASAHNAYASYMLPYPSFMPGNKLYRLTRVADKIKVYWSFGSIARAKAYMSLSDKYLVEAKTLFEYQQYLLGADALKRSNSAFEQIPIYIQQGRSERKDMSGIVTQLKEEVVVHEKMLSQMAKDTPQEFLWTPEKTNATNLSLLQYIEGAIKIRQSIVHIIAPI